jgi:ketosteroid isomerase-like protein
MATPPDGPEESDRPPDDSVDEAAVRAANQRFYEAFEARDLDVMSDCWEHSDRIVCTHPGWRTLRGWGAVSGSWFALFGGPSRLQFILTNEVVAVAGDAAWVTVDENLISPEMGGGTVAALNLFVRAGDRWLLVAHHGSPVAPQPGPDAE